MASAKVAPMPNGAKNNKTKKKGFFNTYFPVNPNGSPVAFKNRTLVKGIKGLLPRRNHTAKVAPSNVPIQNKRNGKTAKVAPMPNKFQPIRNNLGLLRNTMSKAKNILAKNNQTIDTLMANNSLTAENRRALNKYLDIKHLYEQSANVMSQHAVQTTELSKNRAHKYWSQALPKPCNTMPQYLNTTTGNPIPDTVPPTYVNIGTGPETATQNNSNKNSKSNQRASPNRLPANEINLEQGLPANKEGYSLINEFGFGPTNRRKSAEYQKKFAEMRKQISANAAAEGQRKLNKSTSQSVATNLAAPAGIPVQRPTGYNFTPNLPQNNTQLPGQAAAINNRTKNLGQTPVSSFSEFARPTGMNLLAPNSNNETVNYSALAKRGRTLPRTNENILFGNNKNAANQIAIKFSRNATRPATRSVSIGQNNRSSRNNASSVSTANSNISANEVEEAVANASGQGTANVQSPPLVSQAESKPQTLESASRNDLKGALNRWNAIRRQKGNALKNVRGTQKVVQARQIAKNFADPQLRQYFVEQELAKKGLTTSPSAILNAARQWRGKTRRNRKGNKN